MSQGVGMAKEPGEAATAAGRRRFARRCYGHLAGRLGVAVTEALLARGLLRPVSDAGFALTAAGRAWFGALGLAPADLDAAGRRCLDGSERRAHLGGPLGVRLLERLIVLGWLEPAPEPRTLRLTPAGEDVLATCLGLARDGDLIQDQGRAGRNRLRSPLPPITGKPQP